MQIYDRLKEIFSKLQPYNGRWAICGGIAACLYRAEPRYTGDIDIVLGSLPTAEARELAEKLLSSLGYQPKLGFLQGLEGVLIKGPALIMAREDNLKEFVGIDFLLPVQAWIDPAVRRAQNNLIDFGFSEIPTITPEDLIVAKLFALHSSPKRPYDIDDVQSILSNLKDIDSEYILQAIDKYGLKVPSEIDLSGI
ncbi:MAG: nucleotidyl transferase AbiEii/AbiGii toxin family protein [SAR324 cluster bacterium]|uniref:Nucleotidyl transferase AbiEii/AbiGii toxin family protein n=1 Tax=SAR324 cluster bacterium TaxID=2024889 RepID=A0A7X9FP85_9DELT|nr:nucleotidyl transferase AbiEii/AbiGii toxin family protein [SAR324 cluster bacterium]